MPGCLLRVSRGQVTQKRYWDLPLADEGRTRLDEQEAIDEFRRLFDDAVRVRLHGDVEVGAYVSGGLDSMSVARAAAEFSSRRLKVFTVSFRDSALDEGPAAVEFARDHGFEHHVLEVGHGDLAPHFERSLWHSEILVHNSHGAAKLILSGLARRHVKVVLTGEGADEALAGYAAFRHTQLLGALRDSPGDARLRAEVERLQHEMRGGLTVLNSGILPIREYPQYAHVVELFGAYPYGAARAIDALGNTHRVLSNDLLNETGHLDLLDEMARRIGYGRMAGLSPVGAHQYYVFKTDLPAYILCYLGDRVEMANSIEGRVPLLDHPLVEFAFRLPVSLKLRDGQGKYILRRAVHDRLPGVTDVKKRPFIAPSADTLGFSRRSGDLGRYLDPGTLADVGIFDPAAIGWMRRVLPWLPRGSRWRALGEMALTAVVSLHALHDMFCRDFDRSVERFANPNVKTMLAEGAVSVPGAAGTRG